MKSKKRSSKKVLRQDDYVECSRCLGLGEKLSDTGEKAEKCPHCRGSGQVRKEEV